ncbi:MAG: hypothetical protein V4436_03025 [Patescibacteria group bacterium]
MKRMIFVTMFAVAAALSSGTPTIAGGMSYEQFKANCDAKGYPIVTAANGSKSCNSPDAAPAHTASADPVLDTFNAKCEKDGGQVYTASEWNAMGRSPHLDAGQLRCDITKPGSITFN